MSNCDARRKSTPKCPSPLQWRSHVRALLASGRTTPGNPFDPVSLHLPILGHPQMLNEPFKFIGKRQRRLRFIEPT
jgi:hypothetical protein